MKLITISSLLLAASLASSQVTKSGNAYLLRTKYTPGKTIKYNLATSFSSPEDKGASAGSVNLPMSIQVMSLKNGVATVRFITGQPGQTGSSGLDVTVQVNDQNKPVNGSKGAGLGAQFPARKVKVGDTWESATPVPLGGQKGAMAQTKYRFLGIDKSSKKSLAKVSMAIAGPLSGNGQLFLRQEDGTIDHLLLNVLFKNNGATTKIGINLSRLSK